MPLIKLGAEVVGRPEFVRPELLTHPPIPSDLVGLNPRTIMGQAKWDDVRREAYQENNYCCWACGTHKHSAWQHSWLEAHETYTYDEARLLARLKEIVALCHRCHMFVHANTLVGNLDWSCDDVTYVLRSGFLLLDAQELAGRASRANKYILHMCDRELYAALFGAAIPPARMTLTQYNWVLVWKGFEWKRVLDRIRCRPEGSEEEYVRCEREEDGMLHASR